MQHFDQFYKSWNFFTGCYTFDNFFQTEGNGQDSAEFIDFRRQLLLHSKQNKNQNYQTLSSFMINLLVKQPQRGSNMKWSTSKTNFRIFSVSRRVHVLLPKEMWHVQNGRFQYTQLHFAAKNGNWKDMNLIFINFWKIFVYSTSFSSQKW